MNLNVIDALVLMLHNLLMSIFKQMKTRWRSQSIKCRVREPQPITERLQSVSLKSRLNK